MENKVKKISLEKFLNSSFIKNIYPMVERIEITDLDEENGTMKYDVYLDTSDIEYKTMYENNFDPHYLNDHHVKEAINFFSMKIPFRSFDVYKKNRDYLVGYKETNKGAVFYKPNPVGVKSVDLF